MRENKIKKSTKLIDYESSIELMKLRVKNIKENNYNEMLWFLNHNHIYTQGTSAKDNKVIKHNEVKIIKTNRGGKTTYHGPGQRIVYMLIDLNNRKKDIRKFISIVENSLISFLDEYDIQAKSFKDRGVFGL